MSKYLSRDPFTFATMVRKLQIRKLSHLRNVRKPMEKIKSENLRICGLRNLGADRPPLGFTRFSTKRAVLKGEWQEKTTITVEAVTRTRKLVSSREH
jgi:hypothetical protein